MNKRSAVMIALLIALMMIAVACGGSDSGDAGSAAEGDAEEETAVATYSENDVTFDYPEDWQQFSADAAASSMGSNELWDTTVGPDDTNLVNITAYQLNIDVTEENVADIERELDGVIQQVVDQAGGEIASGPTQGSLAGFPSYEYEWTGVDVDGEPKDSRAIFLFNNDVEYFLNCQYSTETEEDVLAGCQLILDTFEATA
ncbi:MAG: hypothetical protein ACRDKT_14330 [Actinomycetota bacterium]